MQLFPRCMVEVGVYGNNPKAQVAPSCRDMSFVACGKLRCRVAEKQRYHTMSIASWPTQMATYSGDIVARSRALDLEEILI